MVAKLPRASEEEHPRRHVGIRKALRKEAQRKHDADMRWVGGILHFTKDRIPVPGVPHVPKPGRYAVGMKGGQPAPKHNRRAPRCERKAARHRAPVVDHSQVEPDDIGDDSWDIL